MKVFLPLSVVLFLLGLIYGVGNVLLAAGHRIRQRRARSC